MLTRCPRCDTTFRVTPEQLKARHGKVRCGECQAVFDALETLIEATPVVAPPVEEPPAPESVPEATDEIAAEEVPLEELAADITEPEAGTELPPPAEFVPEQPSLEEEHATHPTSEQPAADPSATEEWLPQPAAKPRRRWPWALGGAGALFVLAFQAVMHFRTEIAVLHPDTKPLLTTACEVFGCTLLLPRKAELMSIETSDLHPEADGRLTLTATLKNRAPFAQEHPHLELTLTDTADKALVRRVLPPAEYLPKPDRPSGFPSGKEIPIELAIDAPGVPAAGYRLYLFYP